MGGIGHISKWADFRGFQCSFNSDAASSGTNGGNDDKGSSDSCSNGGGVVEISAFMLVMLHNEVIEKYAVRLRWQSVTRN